MKSTLFKDITAVLPVRLQSTRVKNKVLLPFDYKGKKVSLLELKILQLKELLPAQNIIVSCGEEKLIEIAKKYDCNVSFRNIEFIKKGYTTTTEESVREVIKDVSTNYVAWTPVVSPFHTSNVFYNCFKYFINNLLNNEYDSLVTVCSNYHYYWFKNSPLNYQANKNHVQSQNLEPLLKITNGLYLASKKVMHLNGYFLGDKPYLYEVDQMCGIDIDTNFDYKLALSIQNIITNENP